MIRIKDIDRIKNVTTEWIHSHSWCHRLVYSVHFARRIVFMVANMIESALIDTSGGFVIKKQG